MAGVIPYLNIHYGYRPSKRTTIQAGLGYGTNEVTSYGTRFVLADSSHYETRQTQNIRALVVPLTLKFNPFNPYKRLQVYATATVAPVIGHIKARATESLEGETAEIFKEEHASVNVVATAGLTANYRMNERLDIFADGMFLYRSLHKRGALLHHKPVSVGVGLNYNLNLKRER